MDSETAVSILSKCKCDIDLLVSPVSLVLRHDALSAMIYHEVDHRAYPHYRCIMEFLYETSRRRRELSVYTGIEFATDLQNVIFDEIIAVEAMLDLAASGVGEQFLYC